MNYTKEQWIDKIKNMRSKALATSNLTLEEVAIINTISEEEIQRVAANLAAGKYPGKYGEVSKMKDIHSFAKWGNEWGQLVTLHYELDDYHGITVEGLDHETLAKKILKYVKSQYTDAQITFTDENDGTTINFRSTDTSSEYQAIAFHILQAFN